MKSVLFVLILLLTLLTVQSFSQEIPEEATIDKTDDILNAEQIFETYKSALISIWLDDKNFYSYSTYRYIDTTVLNGSGFLISEDGLIGTNYHVVEQIDSLLVKTSDGTFYNAELVLVDEKNDFCIIKLLNTEGTTEM